MGVKKKKKRVKSYRNKENEKYYTNVCMKYRKIYDFWDNVDNFQVLKLLRD